MKLLILQQRDMDTHSWSDYCLTYDLAISIHHAERLLRLYNYTALLFFGNNNNLDELKAMKIKFPYLPIIFIDGLYDSKHASNILGEYADDYVSMNCCNEEIVARANMLMNKPNKEESVYTTGNISINRFRYKVFIKSNEIKFTKKEFLLLLHFVRHEGIVLSRSNIMEHVWDMNADPFSNTIETHIVNLRKKIAPNGIKKIITIPGIGYKFE